MRFTHIENVAKEAISAWRDSTGEGQTKKRKVEPIKADDEAERKRLTKQLSDRDQSIAVLRQMLAEKQSTAKKDVDEEEGNSTASANATQSIDYSQMPLMRLRQLNKARDATISWILKQIDQVEARSITAKDATEPDTAAD